MVLNPHEGIILLVIVKSNRWMNTTEVSKLARCSWNTAYKYLLRFYEMGWVERKGNYWKALLQEDTSK